MARALALAAALLLLSPVTAYGEPLERGDVPELLRPWVDWVLRGHETERCPHLAGGSARHCVWPARLALSLERGSGHFEQEFRVDAESAVALPGSGEHWPETVGVDGRPAEVVPGKSGKPTLRMVPGHHRVTGRFVWSELPQVLHIPPETGLVVLTIDGQQVAFPSRDAQGRLWLRPEATKPAAAENRLEVEVHRRVVDEIPVRLETQIELRVSGQSREVLLGPVLPEGFLPLSLGSPIPARLEPDGRMRAQVRPGRWTLTMGARHEGPVAQLALPDESGSGAWDPSEVWVFEARPNLRLVELEGAAPVDPTQTELPPAWRSFPAFRMERGDTLRLVEKRRGSAGPARDELALARTWHLDFDGGGATVVDQIEGTMRSKARLEMGRGTVLGRAAVNGADQPITRLDSHSGEGATSPPVTGIEVPLGPLQVNADSRVEGGARSLPAVGWDHDFASVNATLQIPPGWRLFYVSGADRARSTWIGRWTLLDLFVVMVVAMAFLRLLGPAFGALAFVTLGLTYTEVGAPQLVWVAVLAAEALRRVALPGRLRAAVVSVHVVSLAVLVLLAVPFALSQLRVGLYPALERPWAMVTDRQDQGAPDQTVADAEDELSRLRSLGYVEGDSAEPSSEVLAQKRMQRGMEARAPSRRPPVTQWALGSGAGVSSYAYAPDPDARIPTGPGRPDWQWETVQLQWSGPVERTQELHLWLVPPWANLLLAILRTGLLLALVGVALGTARDLASRWLPSGWRGGGDGGGSTVAAGSAGIAFALGLGLAFSLPAPAAADIPSPQLLDELRVRLLEPPECLPSCVSIARLGLDVRPDALDARLEVTAAAEAAFPLPGSGGDSGGGGAGFTPNTVLLNGAPAEALLRTHDGRLWLRLPRGTHTVQLRGALAPRETVELPLPLRPHRVEASADGWAVQGLREDGRVEGALQLVRERDVSRPAQQALEASSVPPFVHVTREVQLGLTWQVQTTVQRVAPIEGAIVIEVPLLPGESVTTAGVQVKNGYVLVSLQPGARQAGWTSLLPVTADLMLAAPDAVPWTEHWRVDVSPLWHVEPAGIPWVETSGAQGRRSREWRPWPGEELKLAVVRPSGVAGSTITLDASHLALRPGLRATDATLSLRLRSSQGGSYHVTLPEGGELTAVQMNGREQPIRQEGRDVPLTLVPGTQAIVLDWRQPRGVALVTRAPEIDLALPSVNYHVEIAMPESRWTLWTSGPRLGPAVLFWPILLLLGVLALLLGRIRMTPLRAHHWFLLGIGLTQVPVLASGCVVAWLLALGWRRERGAALAEDTTPGVLFDAMQLALVLLTVAALFALFWSIQNGLLGLPAMQIAGNGSDSTLLRWYQDRTTNVLPMPAVVSVSLWFYRLAMLVWSLWIAQALVRWLRWAWECFSAGHLWLPLLRQSTLKQ